MRYGVVAGFGRAAGSGGRTASGVNATYGGMASAGVRGAVVGVGLAAAVVGGGVTPPPTGSASLNIVDFDETPNPAPGSFENARVN